jgi:N-acetylglucosamine-6-phosphate deacetylase
MPDGEYPIDERVITIRDGAARLPDGTLAGSTLTFERGLRNFMVATGEPLSTVWRCASLNAAQALGVDDRKGSLASGKDADFVLVDEAVNVCLTVVDGHVVYRNGV